MKTRGLILCFGLLLLGSLALHSTNRTGAALADGQRENSPADLPSLALTSPISGFSQPVSITHAGDGSGRIFVVQQGGRIRIVKNGALLSTPFLDISTRLSTGGERGLLGLAFPPGYAVSGRFYVNYTNTSGDTVIARYRRNATNADLADFNSEEIVLTIGQPFANHNGGQLAFGPLDGFLYIGMGDGGSGGDPDNHAQNPNDLLGKVLRINVEIGQPTTYTIPNSNPFFNTPGFRAEIWALGLRNPWRFSFDRQTSDLYVADVGQNSWEEINFQPGGGAGGENYGWRITEGNHCFNPSNCSFTGLTLPVSEYSHSLGCSVTGGYVYRGSAFPRMQGIYFYGDFCTGRIWGLSGAPTTWQNTEFLDTSLSISTFGEDEVGNVYVADYGGTIYTIIDTLPPTPVTIEFSAAQYQVTEGCTSALVTVTRAGAPLANRIDTVDYFISDATAKQKTDFTLVAGRLVFPAGQATQTFSVPITDDAFAEGDESAALTLTNPSANAVLGARSLATLVITDNDTTDGTTNPVDDPGFFVCQHYHDFLSRQSDSPGQVFWTNQITECELPGATCNAELRRINVSGAFFLSIEFRETGFLVERLYKSSYGDDIGTSNFGPTHQLPVPTVRFNEFLSDTQQIGRGVVIGQPGAGLLLESNTQAFIAEFVQRDRFTSAYPNTVTPTQFVDELFRNSGLTPSASERMSIINEFGGTSTSADPAARARALRRVAENSSFAQQEISKAFVLMQYFGYLRRNPDDPQDSDYSGYDFWLTKLNEFGGNFVHADMVKAFIVSAEYRERFGR